MGIKLAQKAKVYLLYFISNIPTKICYILEFQLFITILISPIFLYRGLPISLLSPIGNLIFAPWLIAFLTLSSLIFFTQILNIENSLIIYLLEKLNQLFFSTLNLGSKSFMASCPCPSIIFLIIIPIGLFLIIYIQKSNIYMRVCTLFLVSCLLFFSCKYIWAPKDIFEHFINKNKTILAINHNAKNILVDYGALAEGRNTSLWVRYHLIPILFKKGIDHVDYLIIPYPSSNSLESIIELSQNIPVKYLYIQKWKGRISYKGWKCWKQILNLIEQRELTLKLLTNSLTIKLSKNFIIHIIRQDTLVRKGTVNYNTMKIEAWCNQKMINLMDLSG